MNKLLSAVAVAAAVFCSSAHANIVDIDFTWLGGTGHVAFTGTPEANGQINLADLSTLQYSNSFGQSFDLSFVNAFGTFDTFSNTWAHNASDWTGNATAYLTSSFFGSPFSWSFNTSQGQIGISVMSDKSDVPEPATVALFGLGLFGVAASRRKAVKK